jgi:hypothetical protein
MWGGVGWDGGILGTVRGVRGAPAAATQAAADAGRRHVEVRQCQRSAARPSRAPRPRGGPHPDGGLVLLQAPEHRAALLRRLPVSPQRLLHRALQLRWLRQLLDAQQPAQLVPLGLHRPPQRLLLGGQLLALHPAEGCACVVHAVGAALLQAALS